MRIRSSPEQRARWAADQVQRDADYAEHVERERQRQQAWRDYYLAQEYETFRQRQKRMQAENDLVMRTVGEITKHLSTLAREIDVTKSMVSKRARVQRAAAAETTKRIESVEKASVLIASEVAKREVAPVAKAGKQLIKRRTVRRGPDNRIVAIDETLVEI